MQAERRFSITEAGPAHHSGILECLGVAFAPYRDSYTPDAFADTVLTPATLPERLREMTVFVATDPQGRVIGTIACKAQGCEGHLRGMAVRPEWQGSEVSRRLLRTAEDALRKAQCAIVTLDTTEPLKRATRFYEKNGFRSTGKVTAFFGMPIFEYQKVL